MEQKIEFRDVKDFNKILLSYPVAPHTPTNLDTIAASTLIYGDISKKPIEIHWLDLSESKAKPAGGKCVIHTEVNEMGGMCFGHNREKQLLFVAAREAGMFAYNTETDKQEWKVVGKVSRMEKALHAGGVTTDGGSNLFVSDKDNGCIQMFSASDGQYLGPLMKGVEIITAPIGVQWNAETSSLVAACYFRHKFHFNVINVQ